MKTEIITESSGDVDVEGGESEYGDNIRPSDMAEEEQPQHFHQSKQRPSAPGASLTCLVRLLEKAII